MLVRRTGEAVVWEMSVPSASIAAVEAGLGARMSQTIAATPDRNMSTTGVGVERTGVRLPGVLVPVDGAMNSEVRATSVSCRRCCQSEPCVADASASRKCGTGL